MISRVKRAISLGANIVKRLDLLFRKRVFPNRNQAIEQAVEEKPERMDRTR